MRDDRTLEVILLGDAHRDVALAQRVEDVVVEPAVVPELEHVAAVRGQQPEEAAAAASTSFLQIRRELEEDRAEPVAEQRGVLQQEVDGVGRFGP